jgi:hypothetical protein
MHQEFVQCTVLKILLMCVVAELVDTLLNRFIEQGQMMTKPTSGPAPT